MSERFSGSNGKEETIVFLLDVDNTLLDNDRLKEDLASRLQQEIGPDRAQRFWQIYEEVRDESDVVDFPRTIREIASEYHDPVLASQLEAVLQNWPFSSYLYPGALEAIDYLKTLGTPVVLSDGDEVFQRFKIHASGLEAAVGGNVLIYVHKEEELKDVFARYPATCYVAIDDKPRILSTLERDCPTEFTTVLVLQGKYAHPGDSSPSPDYIVQSIGNIPSFSREDFLHPSPTRMPK